MRRISLVLMTAILGSCLMVSAAWGQSLPGYGGAIGFNAGGGSAIRSPQAETAGAMARLMAMVDARKECKHGCHICDYGPFPGVVDYCTGLHDWKKGHYQGALEYLKFAAGWGNKNAQYNLGLIYWGGRNIPADRALGIAWLEIANERHDNPHFALVERSMVNAASAAQRKRAQQLYAHLLKRYGDKVAGVRAWQHVRHWRFVSTENRMVESGQAPNTTCVTENGKVVPWRDDLATNPHASCFQSGKVGKLFAKVMSHYFEGMRPQVKIGPLQEVPASASSTSGS